jgi:hypothetical protein
MVNPGSERGPVMRWAKIVAIPEGEAPPEVRSEWVGLTLPLSRPDQITTHTIGVLSGQLKPSRIGYLVDGRQAVDILATKAPWAAAWWREQAPHVIINDYQLVFSIEVCEIV